VITALPITYDDPEPDGDMVVVLSEGTVGGETAREVDVLTLRDGKTVRAEAHTDTALMERVYGKKQAAAR
jgi:ketosteroid isomerase-like protein